MKKRRANQAISEVVGTALLLGIAIGLFAVVQLIVYSYPFEPAPPSVNIVGSINENTIYLEHHGGEAISNKSKIIIFFDSVEFDTFEAGQYLDNEEKSDGFWNIGEIVSYIPINETTHNPEDLTDVKIEITVVDHETNSVIMMGVIQD